MGSSKKHKEKDKEHKKKRKHKDRSRSKSPKERKHKKDKKRGYEDDDHEEPETKRPREFEQYDDREYERVFDRYEDSKLMSNTESRGRNDYEAATSSYGREKDREQSSRYDRHHYRHAEAYFDDEPENSRYANERRTTRSEVSVPMKSEAASNDVSRSNQGSGGEVALSIEETNKLRLSLGLKPLERTKPAADKNNTESSGGLQEDIHAPAVNISNVKKQEELKQKLLAAKEKRRINQLLGKVKTLGGDSDDDDALAWVKRSRKLQQEREMADKRAKILDMMDEEFGVGDLLEEEFGSKKKKPEYSSRDLRGLKVDHDQETFDEGRTVILTLKDKGILDEENDDVLENVNMIDSEKAKENIENKKKKLDYKPYDEPDMDEYGMIKNKDILEKYDEEIHGKKKETFELGSGGKYDATHERKMEEIRRTIKQQGQALVLPPPTIAREFYTENEMAGFNKVKKKVRKKKKVPTATLR